VASIFDGWDWIGSEVSIPLRSRKLVFCVYGVVGRELGAEWHLAASRAGQDAAQPGEPR